MSSKTYPKTMQLSFTEEQHERLRRAAYEGGVTMNECVRRLVDGWKGVMGGVESVSESKSKGVKTRSEPVNPLLSAYVGGGVKTSPAPVSASPVGVPVTDEEVPEKRCFKCKMKVREWTMTEKGPICPDCKSQMEVSIP